MLSEKFLLENAIFTTRDFALQTGLRTDSAARLLKRYSSDQLIVKVTRGLWANKHHQKFSSYALTPYLLASEQGYISFLTALQMHGVISQISSRIQVASTGHSRKLKSVVGDFEFLQLNPKYFNCGIEWTTHQHPYAMACPEKALLDCLYISSKKGKRFRHFSELDLNYLNPSKFKKILKEHNFNISVENYLLERFNHLLQKNK